MKFNASTIAILIASASIFTSSTTHKVQAAQTLRANGKIAFTSDRDGNSEIYLMNADGTGQMRLTNSPQREDYPTWSPDGSKIAFLRQQQGISSINVMNADGTRVIQLTTLVLTSDPSYPFERFSLGWSPDGAKIVFQDSTDIFTINIDGSNRINLTDGQFNNYEPSWSPDGSRIAFARSDYSHGYYSNVFVMNTDGSNITKITNSLPYGESRSPDWSPDGKKIAFAEDDDFGWYISIVNPDGTNLQVNHYGFEPKWSPDGTKIIFYDSPYPAHISQIWVMNRDGSGLTQLTNKTPNNFHPDWQPLVVSVTNLEELYSAVNDPANAGAAVNIAPNVYMLSVTDPNGAARPNGGRLELQQNMSLQGVVGDRGAVVIDAANLPASSYNGEVTNAGAIRMGRGTNSIEWLTIRNAVNGGAGVIAHLSAPGTANIHVAHIVSTGNTRGIDVRNIGAASVGYVINGEIIDNDLHDNSIGIGTGLRIINLQGAMGSVVSIALSGNRSFNNFFGIIIENTGSTNLGSISVSSSDDRFFENGLGALVGGGLGTSNSNTVNLTAIGTSFENNNGFNNFDHGGLIAIGGENTAIPNGASDNTVSINLRSCRFANNQLHDLAAFGARSNPISVGQPGTNNHVTVRLYGTNVPILESDDSIPDFPDGLNTVNIIKTANFDYDGDGKSDISVWRPGDGVWHIIQSQSQSVRAQGWGLNGDKLAPADFDGDGKTDLAVFRASDSNWYIFNSSTNTASVAGWGLAGDMPVPADYGGDGKADLAVYRPSEGKWYRRDSDGKLHIYEWGLPGDKPAPADFNGDGVADMTVFRPSEGKWYILNSGNASISEFTWGLNGDLPIPGDYSGDGKSDFAVFRPSNQTWYRIHSDTFQIHIITWGLPGDFPTPGDYDGDGRNDLAVFRPSNSTWFINSSTGGIYSQPFGLSGDIPVENAFVY